MVWTSYKIINNDWWTGRSKENGSAVGVAWQKYRKKGRAEKVAALEVALKFS